MLINPFVRDLTEFHDQVTKSLESESTRIYLDTSTLMWLVRLSAKARYEFIDWCSSRNTFVPVWAAHEFHRHLVSGTVRKGITKVISETSSKQHEFVRLASEQADNELCWAKGFESRDSYISEIQRVLASFEGIGKVLEITDTQYRKAADEVITFVNSNSLNTDLDPMIDDLSTTGIFRLNHRVPPGYQDGHKEENSLGDAVIWREILNDLDTAANRLNPISKYIKRVTRRKRVDGILISRDQKTDWVSTSDVRLANGEVKRSNREIELDVTLPHPLLRHEFSLHGGGNFFIVHPGALSGIVEKTQEKVGDTSSIAAWRAASLDPKFIDQILAISKENKKREVIGARVPSIQASDINASVIPLPDLGSIGPDLLRSKIEVEIQQYTNAKEDGDQEDILKGWFDDVEKGRITPIKFGRMLFALVNKGHIDITEVVPTIDVVKRNLPAFASHIVLGVIGQVYFNEEGEVRTQPLFHLARVLLALEDSPDVGAAFDTLNRWLKAQTVCLPYIPGSKTTILVEVSASAETKRIPATLSEIRVGSHSVLVDDLPLGHPRLLTSLLADNESDGSKLLGVIAYEYMLPKSKIKHKGIEFNKIYRWGEGVGLLPIDTYAPGGIGELNGEED